MKASICMATCNRPLVLARTLESIYAQVVPFDFEVIVADDSTGCNGTEDICAGYPVVYKKVPRQNADYRNPAVARNMAYKAARGEVIIAQSDDVYHATPDAIRRLVEDLHCSEFLLATVINVDTHGLPYCDPAGIGYGDRLKVYVSPKRPRPLFFLGSLWHADLYAVGGCDEEFTAPAREDAWFALCLQRGRGLRPRYTPAVVGHHQHHQHCWYEDTAESRELFDRKFTEAKRTGRWLSSGGPWA